jgi:hypothetical protein
MKVLFENSAENSMKNWRPTKENSAKNLILWWKSITCYDDKYILVINFNVDLTNKLTSSKNSFLVEQVILLISAIKHSRKVIHLFFYSFHIILVRRYKNTVKPQGLGPVEVTNLLKNVI